MLGATYSSVLVCLTLVQTNLEGYPGLAAAPQRIGGLWLGDLGVLLLVVSSYIGFSNCGLPGYLYIDLPQGEGD
jgi:hypothetical protein